MKKSILALISTIVLVALCSSAFVFSAKGVIEIQMLKDPDSLKYYDSDKIKIVVTDDAVPIQNENEIWQLLGVTKTEPVEGEKNTYLLTVSYKNLSEYLAIIDGLLAGSEILAVLPVSISIIDNTEPKASKLNYTISDAIKSFMFVAGKGQLTDAQKAFYDFRNTGITLTDSMMLFMQVAGKNIPSPIE